MSDGKDELGGRFEDRAPGKSDQTSESPGTSGTSEQTNPSESNQSSQTDQTSSIKEETTHVAFYLPDDLE